MIRRHRQFVGTLAAAVAVASAATAQGPAQVPSVQSRTDYAAWPSTIDSCAFCHGDQGQSVNARYPNLAGQPAAYIAAQLRAFAAGQRRNANMGPLALQLGERDITELAAYYAKQPARANPYDTGTKAILERGRRLVAANGCAACHGARLTGTDAIPRLAGQGAVYLARQLDAFASEQRSEPSGVMKMLSAARTPAERQEMAAYLASLDPKGPTR